VRRRPRRLLLAALLTVLAASPLSASGLRVTWDPPKPRGGDVVLMRLDGAPPDAQVEAELDGHPVSLFPLGDGHAAMVGIDMDAPAGPRSWKVTAGPMSAKGQLRVAARTYEVQHLTVAPSMSELDPETEQRALREIERLRATYRTITAERLWRGSFVRPVDGDRPGTGFGSRRVINGKPRSPHGGIDFPAPTGAEVRAVNRGRVALVGEFYFPGRLVVLDHGLGLHTLYFHLDTIAVTEGQIVARGETLGTVGMTGRVTGPHLHFGAQVGAARVDPAVLLGLRPDRVPD
jgi:murein DD-endopeptidase MepM/ murein hydrolase activator NlpD